MLVQTKTSFVLKCTFNGCFTQSFLPFLPQQQKQTQTRFLFYLQTPLKMNSRLVAWTRRLFYNRSTKTNWETAALLKGPTIIVRLLNSGLVYDEKRTNFSFSFSGKPQLMIGFVCSVTSPSKYLCHYCCLPHPCPKKSEITNINFLNYVLVRPS